MSTLMRFSLVCPLSLIAICLVRGRQFVFPNRRQTVGRPVQNRAGARACRELEMAGRAAGEEGVGHAAAGGAGAEAARHSRARTGHAHRGAAGDLRSEERRHPHQDREEVRHDRRAVEAVQRPEGRPHSHRPVLRIPTPGQLLAMVPPPPPPPDTKKEPAGKKKTDKPAVAPEPDPDPGGEVQRELENVLLQVFLDREMFSPGMIDGKSGATFLKISQIYQNTHADAANPGLLKAKAEAALKQPYTRYILRADDFKFIKPPKDEPVTARSRESSSARKKNAKADERRASTTAWHDRRTGRGGLPRLHERVGIRRGALPLRRGVAASHQSTTEGNTCRRYRVPGAERHSV